MVSDYWSVAVPADHAPGGRRLSATAGALALPAGIDVELPDALCYGEAAAPDRAGDLAEELDRPGRAPGAARRRSNWACSTRTGRRRRRWPPAPASTSTRRSNRAIARRLAERVGRAAGQRRHCCRSARPARDDRGGRAVRGRPAGFLGCYSFPNHVLGRAPGLRPRLEMPTRCSTRCAAEFPAGRDRVRTGLPDPRRRPVRHRAARATPPQAADAGDRGGRRPGRPVRPGHLRRGLRRRRPDPARRPGRPGRRRCWTTGTPVVLVVVSGRPYALGDAHRGGGRGAGVHPRRGGRPGDRRRAVRPGQPDRPAAGAGAAAGRRAARAPTCSRRSACTARA